MNNKLKCQVHNQISIGQVGSTLVCIQCDCSNMIYCQNLRIVEITHLIKSRLKNRGEIKKLQQQKFKINNDKKRLETQHHFNDQKDIEIFKMKAEYYKKILKLELYQSKLLQIQLEQQLQEQINLNSLLKINSLQEESIKLNEQLYSKQLAFLLIYEEQCLAYLEEIFNAEFIIHHISNRKKWTTNYMKHESSMNVQQVQSIGRNQNFYCKIIGNKAELNQPLEGYYIVFIQSMIYDGYWKNGRLIDGTASYMESSREFHSFDASTLMDNEVFRFNNCITFYHSEEEHFRYLLINDKEVRRNKKLYIQENN